MNKKQSTRTRNWTFIVYPESAPDNWKELLQKEFTPFAVSPLHNLDVNEGTGEIKKAHWHVLIKYKGVKTYEQVLKAIKPLNGSIPQPVANADGLIRYFVHRDNPEKAQYDIADIFSFMDVDIVSPFQTSTSRYDAISAMMDFVDEEEITEIKDLLQYARRENQEWFRYLCDNSAYIVESYIKSCRHSKILKK